MDGEKQYYSINLVRLQILLSNFYHFMNFISQFFYFYIFYDNVIIKVIKLENLDS